MTMMKSVLKRIRSQRGQVIIMFVGIFSVIAVIGVITVDFGLWLSERRGAQTDADLPALAGARECMLETASGTASGGAYSPDVQGAVQRWFDENNEGNASLAFVSPDCEVANGLSCVSVDVRHGSAALFSSIFEKAAPDIGAHAKACAGAANAPGNVVPFEVETPGPCFIADEPNFGAMCPIEGSSHDPNPRGMLDLEAGGNYCSDANGDGDIEDMIADGAPGTCLINEGGLCDPSKNGPWYDCVAVQDGNPRKVLDGTETRIAREGACDTNHDGVDSFDESVTLLVPSSDPSKRVYQAKDCDPNTEGEQISPRLITIVVLDTVPSAGNTGYPITAFAGFYLDGCGPDNLTSPSQLNNNQKKCNVGNPGQQVVYGSFVNVIVSGSGIGPVDPSTTMFGIALTE